MALFKDSKFAEYGIITRASKGAELTHVELDNNIVTALDIRFFNDASYNGMEEYPSIISADVAPTAGNTVTLTPVNGYCALKLEGSANVENSIEIPTGVGAWIYRSDFYTVDTPLLGEVSQTITVNDGDEYLVISSLEPVSVTFVGSPRAGIVRDIPPLLKPSVPPITEGM